MKIIQRIKQPISTLLAIVWFFSIAGCRDFKDSRTPYNSFVTVGFQPINKNDKLIIAYVTNTATGNRLSYTDKRIRVPLDSNADSIQLDIYGGSPATSLGTLTITYQKEAVLISHQCGCAYKYLLKEMTFTGAGKYKIINKELSTFNDSKIDVQIYL